MRIAERRKMTSCFSLKETFRISEEMFWSTNYFFSHMIKIYVIYNNSLKCNFLLDKKVKLVHYSINSQIINLSDNQSYILLSPND
jgi:hypothetical protein